MTTHLTWAQIDLGAIAHNVGELRRLTHPDARLMAIVKADAYGHGAIRVTRAALASGADALGVARIDEGIELRRAGVEAPLLIMGHTLPGRAVDLIRYNLTQTVYTLAAARALDEAARTAGRTITVHLKIDTGMGRLGMVPDEWACDDADDCAANRKIIADIERIMRLGGLDVEGIMTHFAKADEHDKTFTHRQLERFTTLIDQLKQNGIEFTVRHAANSAGIIDLPESHFDMVRAGISMYGLRPSDEVHLDRLVLKPAMTLNSTLINLKTVPAGFTVSYGATHRTARPTCIGTVAIGYADGFSRAMSNTGHMLVRGERAPIVGRICMDLTMLDVGHITSAALGDTVTVFGRQDQAEIPADEVAGHLNTINYEITASITSRVARVYLNEGFEI